MRAILALVMLTLPAAADELEAYRGLYGSATDPTLSCATNPHRLDFYGTRLHAGLEWQNPWFDAQGREVRARRFDVWSTEGFLTLEEDGPAERLADGSLPVWHRRLTAEGYCWGRADWPVMRCENRQLRCDAATS